MPVDPDLAAAQLIQSIRRSSGLSRAELARRAGIQRSVLSAYENSHRQPSVAALARIAAAGGSELQVSPCSDCLEHEHAAKVLSQVLELAEQLPYRPRQELAYPPLIRLAA